MNNLGNCEECGAAFDIVNFTVDFLLSNIDYCVDVFINYFLFKDIILYII